MRFKEILLEEQNKKDETVEEELRWYRVQHGLLHDVFLRAGKNYTIVCPKIVGAARFHKRRHCHVIW